MRFERVNAFAFGPFNSESLDLAPGMNVIWGPNEAGKSRWHGAIFAALCGIKRGRGQADAATKQFRELYRPWDGDQWRVGLIVTLADGRRVEIQQELDGRVDCRASDAVTGADYSNEIIFEGSPDGSRWLGLDRRSFPAIACVRQADILGVVEGGHPAALQEHLQRAAATAGTDATAALALSKIAEFRTERVGEDRRGSRKPLPAARQAQAAAEIDIEEARRQHDTYVADLVLLEELREKAQRAEQQHRAARAAALAVQARELEKRLLDAQELSRRHPVEPPPLVGDVLVDRVAAALANWEQRPSLTRLEGPTAEEIQREVDSLPAVPAGDLEVDAVIAAAAHDLEVARNGLRVQDASRPLEVPAATPPRRRGTALLAAGAVAALVGIVLVVAGLPLPGSAALVVGVAVAFAGTLRWRAANTVDPAAALSAWQAARGRFEEEITGAEKRLANALAARGITATADPASAVASYIAECARRSRLAAAGARRPDLEKQVTARLQAEAVAGEAQVRLLAAEEELGEVASACAVAAPTPEEAATGLRIWLEDHRATLTAVAGAREEWAQLQALLGGRSLEELSAEENRHSAAARDAAAVVSPEMVATAAAEVAPENLKALVDEAADARDEFQHEQGRLQQVAASLPSVPDAEERLAAANAEHERVRRLAATLSLTEEFLRGAQERVHRDVSGRLADCLRPWLPRVTGGRYIDVRVDPASLKVEVCGSDRRWRDARFLSHGTAEQVYLLLRVAMADHLTKEDEVCPLLLDEVTVQFDKARSAAVLDLLHELSNERQVVLFSQEDEVLAWAEDQLDSKRDVLVKLDVGAPSISDSGSN